MFGPIGLAAFDDEVGEVASSARLPPALHVVHELAQPAIDEHVVRLVPDALGNIVGHRAASLEALPNHVEEKTVGELLLLGEGVLGVERFVLREEAGDLGVIQVVSDETGFGHLLSGEIADHGSWGQELVDLAVRDVGEEKRICVEPEERTPLADFGSPHHAECFVAEAHCVPIESLAPGSAPESELLSVEDESKLPSSPQLLAVREGIILVSLLEGQELRALGEEIMNDDALARRIRFEVLGEDVKLDILGPVIVEALNHGPPGLQIASLVNRGLARVPAYFSIP